MILTFARYGLILFTFANLLNYMDRYLMAVMGPVLAEQFNLDKSQTGFLFSAYVPSYILLAPVFGWLGDRYSRTKLAAAGVLVWSLACFASAFAFNFETLVLARLLIGAGEASFSALVPAFLKDSLPDSVKLNRSLAIFYTAIPAGTALGYIVGGWITRDFGWQTAFWAAGLPGMVLAFFLFGFKDTHRSEKVSTAGVWESIKTVLGAKVYRLTCIGFIANSAALTAVAAFVTEHCVSLGVNLKEAGLVLGLVMLISGIIGTYGGGQLSSFIAARANNKILVFLIFISAVSLLAAPIFFLAFALKNFIAFIICCFFGLTLMFSVYAPVCSVVVLSSPPQMIALAQGLNMFVINLFGSLPGPILIGYLADQVGLLLALKSSVILIVISAVIWCFASKVAIGADE